MGEKERPNAHMLFLPTELFMGLIKKMAALEVGKSAAILDCLNESLHAEGYIDDETYKTFKKGYRRKLLEVVEEKRKEKERKLKPITTRQIEVQEQEKIKTRKYLLMVNEQWDKLPDKARQYHLKTAERFKDEFPEAKGILKKAGILKEYE
ncbi:MAG: hypothetical protein QMD13_03520 [Candidatus Bathyarchaeia archaeon]|nr:hypothetical protein [Candidatus Bathyarchaeia archaeon]